MNILHHMNRAITPISSYFGLHKVVGLFHSCRWTRHVVVRWLVGGRFLRETKRWMRGWMSNYGQDMWSHVGGEYIYMRAMCPPSPSSTVLCSSTLLSVLDKAEKKTQHGLLNVNAPLTVVKLLNLHVKYVLYRNN